MASNIDSSPDLPDPEPQATARRRIKLIVAYDGSGFHGWQKQEPPNEAPLRTVQGEIESALRRLLGEPISMLGASRTDAGVHARGQVAQFDAVCRVPIRRLAEALTSRLAPDIDIVSAEEVSDDFDCISDVKTKQYRYRIHNSPRRPLERRQSVFHGWVDLDVQRMIEAAPRFVGTHDMVGLASAKHGRTTTVRTIHACSVVHENDEIIITVEGSGFLYNQVRIMAGTLFEIGRGRLAPDIIDRIYAEKNRRLAGATLPPEGLCLEWIGY